MAVAFVEGAYLTTGNCGKLRILNENALIGRLGNGGGGVYHIALDRGKADHHKGQKYQGGAGEAGADLAPVHVVEPQHDGGNDHTHPVPLGALHLPLGLLKRIVTGKASLKNLSGPITIAQIARDSARLGVSQFLRFLGLLSLSLAILNFLPIPLLDGGHLLYFGVEWLKGSPVSEQTQLIGQYLGLFALVALMSLTFYNDILRLMS